MARKGVQFKVKANQRELNDVLDKLGKRGAVDLMRELDEITEKHTMQMANKAAEGSPWKSGKLAGSIPASVKKLTVGKWTFGSDAAYARRQEYEHKSKKGFFRRAIWNGRNPFRDAIKTAIKRRGR